ncbi:unnamed protein product, partial [Closterium sp. NIES-54]
MEVARTSMIHAPALHFLWPFAVRYAAHQLNLWPRVSLLGTSPTLRWTGEVGDASVFRVWGSRAFVRDTSADKLSPRAIPYVFLGFVPDTLGWKFYHPTSRRVFPSQDITFDESVPFYRLFPYRSAPPLPPPIFLAPGPPPVDPLPPQGPAPSGVSQVDPLPGTAPLQVAVDSGAARGAASGGVEPGGAESEGAETGGVWALWLRVRDTSADKLSPRAIPYVFLGFVPDTLGWKFYHPTSRRVFPSQDVTFDESVPFYRLFPYRSAPPLPPPIFLAPGPPPVDPLPPQGPAPSGVSQVDPLPGTAPLQVAVDSGAARGAASGGVEPGGAESEGAETGGSEPGGVETGGGELGGAEPEGVEPGGAAPEGSESGGEEPRGAALSGGSAGASPRLSLQQLREWFVRRAHLRSGASGAGGAGSAGGGGTGVAGGAGVTGGTAATGSGGARTRGIGAAGNGGTGAGRAGAGGAGAARVLGVPSSTGLTPPLPCPPPDQSQLLLQLASPLPAPSPYTEHSRGLTERCEPATRPVSPVRTARRVPRSRPPPVPGTHAMALRPSSVPLRVPLPSPPESSLPEVPDPESDCARAASPTVARLLATAVTVPSFESAAASALVAELLDFAATCRLDYASALVAESVSASPPSVGGECALGTDVLEDKQEDFECLAAAVPRFASMLLPPEGDLDALDIPTPRSYAEAITGPYSSQWQAAMDAEMASWKSTGTYVDEVPPPGANIVDGMWIFRVKWPPDSPPAFKARYVARGFSQRQGVDYFQAFSPTPKMTTLRVLLHVAAQRDYELHSLDFTTAFLQGSLHEEIWLRRPPGFTESFPA